ncbi:amidohydrolase, partial [bacterium]
ITAHRGQDIASALRLQKEFGFRMILDGGAEATRMLPELKAANVSVMLHPAMLRPEDDADEASYETAAKLQRAGIPFAFTSGYEGYVPKVRVVPFEAAIYAANGLGVDEALRVLTIGGARFLGLEKRIGTLEAGKDADLALFDGPPLEYTTHCVGTVIDGEWAEGSR